MRKPGGMIAIMFGHPSPMAHEDNDAPPRDEDNLNREQEFGDDGPADTLELLYDRLKRGDEVAASSAMGIARCIQEMAHRAAAGDKRGLKHFYKKARELISHVDGEDDDGE